MSRSTVPRFHEHAEVGDQIVGRSPTMQDVYKAIGRVAPQDVTVLIRGESGTGKELVARAIYQHSKRCDGPFLAVNCAAIPDSAAGKRTLRPRERLVHRRRSRAHRQVRAMQRRHDLPRRSRRHVAARASQDAARAARATVRARRRQRRRSRPTCASSPPRIAIWNRWSKRASSARTCTIA